MENLVCPELMDNLDLKDLRVHKDNPVQVDPEVSLVREAMLDPRDSRVRL